MTNTEAIEILYHIGGSYGDVSKYHMAVSMAISALEKQEGKKPIDRRCPKCESDNVEVWQDGGYGTTKFNFCPDCGQRIDWSDEHGTN